MSTAPSNLSRATASAWVPAPTISAHGDATLPWVLAPVALSPSNPAAPSPDQIGSAINISGGAQGGNGGKVEISAPEMTSIQSAINGQAATGYVNGEL